MAAREFHVLFHNDTPFELVRGTFTEDHGHWTTEPPEVIAPHARYVPFGLDSDGWFRGVEGEVYYRIQDKGKPVRDHVGEGGQFRLHFQNPFWGGPDSVYTDGRFAMPADELSPADASKDYELRSGGIRPSSDTTGPVNTDGFVEIVPGTPIVLPIPWGHLGHVWAEWQLRVKPVAPPPAFHVAEPPPETKSRPIASGSAAPFVGRWAERSAGGIPRLLVTLRSVDGAGDVFDVDVEDRETPLSLHAKGCRFSVEPIAPPYSAALWSPPDAGRVHVDVTHLSPFLGLAPRVERAPVPLRFDAASTMRLSVPLALTLHVDRNVALVLYGDFTSDGTLFLRRLRYLRTADDGTRLMDVLLMPFSSIR
jgi:hypothetical protein